MKVVSADVLAAPASATEVIIALQRSLFLALVRRGDTWHLRTCMDAGVNSRRYGCSDRCLETQVALAWAQDWRERYGARTVGQLRLLEAG